MRNRRAISLIELLAVLSGCSVVLGLTASLLHQTMRAQSHTRKFFDVERTSQRLARQFRSDVHAAAVGAIDIGDEEISDDDLIRLEVSKDQTVRYQRAADKIIRISSQGDGATAREEYALGDSMRVRVRRLQGPQRFVLLIDSSPTRPSLKSPSSLSRIHEAPVSLQVEAIPARDWRYYAANMSSQEGI